MRKSLKIWGLSEVRGDLGVLLVPFPAQRAARQGAAPSQLGISFVLADRSVRVVWGLGWKA